MTARIFIVHDDFELSADVRSAWKRLVMWSLLSMIRWWRLMLSKTHSRSSY